MKWSVIGLVLLGVAAAICAAVLVASLGSRAGPLAMPGSNQSQRVPVLVAATDLPALHAVTADAVTKTMVVQTAAPADCLSEPFQAIGKVLAVPLSKGQVFTASLFAPRGSGLNIAAQLPEGKRAVMVTLANAASLGGLLYPGAQVDVLASFNVEAGGTGRALSTILLQGVEVLAVEGETVGAAPATAGPAWAKQQAPAAPLQSMRITLLLNPQQAEALQVASAYGSISLALRNPHDGRQIPPGATVLKGSLSDSRGLVIPVSWDGSIPPGPPQGQPPPTTEPSPPTAQQRLSAKPSTPQWDVIVLRGSAVEVHSFPVPKGSHAGGDNDVRN